MMTKNKTKNEILVIPKRKYTKKNDKNKPIPEQATNNKKDYDSDESNDNKKDIANKKQSIKTQGNSIKKSDKEIKIDNLIQSLNDDEIIKLQAKNEKLKSKLMKMI